MESPEDKKKKQNKTKSVFLILALFLPPSWDKGLQGLNIAVRIMVIE